MLSPLIQFDYSCTDRDLARDQQSLSPNKAVLSIASLG
jgi:hypothetical protein